MPLRILHTSDWHLGGTLDGVSRLADHARFLEWLTSTVATEEIDVLIVAGDVFDQANPSAEAQQLYYRFLGGLSATGLRHVVVVAGNHDSPSRLEAPRDLLGAMGIHVVGGFTESPESRSRLLVPLTGRSGAVEAVAIALPYVHEYRLGIRTTALSVEETAAVFERRFAALYRELADEAAALHPGVPLVATGHLSCHGAAPEDYPVPIHQAIRLGGLPETIFDPRLSYVALGHIHRCMPVGTGRAWYSGTPVPLNLREGAEARQVLQVDVDAQGSRVRSREVPCFRGIREIVGPPEVVIAALDDLTWGEAEPPLIYVRMEVDRPDSEAVNLLRRAHAARWPESEDRPRLVRIRQVVSSVSSASDPAGSVEAPSLRDLEPEAVFVQLCEQAGAALDDELLQAFRSLLSAGSARQECA